MDNYVVRIRRELHSYPEVGFDLERTLGVIRRELDALGVPYTEKYGKSSIVASVNEGKGNFTVAVRADTDALPIEEKNDVEYKSKNVGKMHACGHDAHTAIALDALRRVFEMRDRIPYCVKFVFQSAEEYTESGARLMVEDGAAEGIDCIIALHCDPAIPSGKIGIASGPISATSDGFYLNFYGKSVHVAKREQGVDAIRMAHRAYADICSAIESLKEQMIFHVGKIEGGTTNNIVADSCSLFCTLRTHSDELAERYLSVIEKEANGVASKFGGRAEIVKTKHYPVLNNDKKIADLIRESAISCIGEENVVINKRGMIGEDFSYFCNRVPGAMFRLGVRNEAIGISHELHTNTFDLDEAALQIGSDIYLEFILNQAKKLQK